MCRQFKAMDYTDIGARIREARKVTGMTQEQLAEAAELATSYVSQLESGTKCARLDTLARIADALHIPLTQLLVDRQLDCDALLALAADCTDAERQIIFDVIQALKRSLRTNAS